MTPITRTALMLLLLLSAVAPAEGTGTSLELVLAGVVADGAGRPVPGAHVVVQSDHRLTATTDHAGGFRVHAMLPSAERLRAQPCTLQVFVTARKLRMVTPGGDASITLALSVESTPDHGDRAVAHGNDERIAAIAAGLVAAGRGVALVDSVRFLALDGERIGDPPLAKMPHQAQAPLAMTMAAPGPSSRDTVQLPPGVVVEKPMSPMPTGLDLATRPAAPVAAPKPTPPPAAPEKAALPPGTSAAKTPASTGAKPSTNPPAKPPAATGTAAKTGGGNGAKAAVPVKVTVHDGAPIPPRPAPAPSTPGCTCRIKGTVELMMDPPPTEPVGVALWAEDAPTFRDSVVIALGPPRPFELVGLPCGSHHLLVRSSSRHPYVIAEPRDMTLPCSAGQLLQPRIVLRPR